MKRIVGFFCLVLLGLCLVSCTDSNQDDEDEYFGAKKIVFWHNMNMGSNLQELFDEAIQDFEKENDGWKIELVFMETMEKIVEKTLSDSIKPDLVFADLEHTARYMENDLIMDMNAFIRDYEIGFSQNEINDFFDAFYLEGGMDGAMYSLPFAKATDVLYYYQDSDGKASYPKTWEEFDLMEDALLEVESESRLFFNLAQQSGAGFTSLEEHYIFDNAKNRSNVEMLKQWYDQKRLYTWQTPKTSTKDSNYIIASSGALHFYKYNTPSDKTLMAARIPTFDGKEQKVSFYGPSLCMLKQHSAKMKQTWKFIKEYLLDTEFQAKFSMKMNALYSPVLKSSYEVSEFVEWVNQDPSLASVMEICRKYDPTYCYNAPLFVGCEKALLEGGRIITDVLTDTKTIDQAFQDALKNCKSCR